MTKGTSTTLITSLLAIGLGLMSFGCTIGLNKPLHLNLSAVEQVVAQKSGTVVILSPAVDNTKISYSAEAGVTISGTCTTDQGDVSLSGDAAGSIPCLSGGTWSSSLDLTSVSDGPVSVIAKQGVGAAATRLFVKDASFCGDPSNSGAAPFAGGDGSSATPYLICTPTQLLQIGSNLSSNFQLRNDIDLSSTPWTSVGPYDGDFDGAGFVISNATITGGGFPTGFFTEIGGSITNFGLSNASISSWCHDGILVGEIDSGATVSNSWATGVKTFSSVTDNDTWGGLAGINSGTVTNSWTNVSISDSGGGSVNIGGLVGDNYGTITNSFALGSITLANAQTSGGLVGQNENSGTISNSFATGSISGDSLSNTIGGLVGNNMGTISNSFSTGIPNAAGPVGGLAATNSGTITSSYWDMDTSGLLTSAGGSGLSDAQMQQGSQFVGWDFSSTWILNSSYSLYPVLTWNP